MYKIKQISGYVDMSRVNQTCVVDNDEVNKLFRYDCLAIDDHYAELWSNKRLEKYPHLFGDSKVLCHRLSSSCCDQQRNG